MQLKCLKKGSYCRVMIVGVGVIATYLSGLGIITYILICLASKFDPFSPLICP